MSGYVPEQDSQIMSSTFYVLPLAATLVPYGTLFTSPSYPQALYPDCSIIVDSGFSFTHVIPIMRGQILWGGVRRY